MIQTKSRRKAPPRPNQKPIFEDYVKLINSISWKWHLRTGWEYDELMAEGNLIFVKCSRDYNPQKSKFSSRLGYFLDQHFQNLINLKRCKKRTYIPVELDENFFGMNYSLDNYTSFLDLISDLPEDAKEIINAIFETPAEIIEVLGIKKISQHSLFRYFTEFRGWKQVRVRNAFQDIIDCLN